MVLKHDRSLNCSTAFSSQKTLGIVAWLCVIFNALEQQELIDRPRFVSSNGHAIQTPTTTMSAGACTFAWLLSVALLTNYATAASPGFDARGRQFVWFDSVNTFSNEPG